MRWVRQRLSDRGRRLVSTTHLKTGYVARGVLEGTGLPVPKRPWNLALVASSLAARRYRPAPSEIRVEFFPPESEPSDAPTPWDALARGGVVVRPIIGEGLTHETLISGAGVPWFVEVIRESLEEALDPTRGEMSLGPHAPSPPASAANGQSENGQSLLTQTLTAGTGTRPNP